MRRLAKRARILSKLVHYRGRTIDDKMSLLLQVDTDICYKPKINSVSLEAQTKGSEETGSPPIMLPISSCSGLQDHMCSKSAHLGRSISFFLDPSS